MAYHLIRERSLAAFAWRRVLSHALAVVAGIALGTTLFSHTTPQRNPVPLPTAASDFDRALRTLMVRIGSEMCIAPSGDADSDFARAMIPHHQGAVEMARLELLYGHDNRLRRLAQGIVIEQSQEMALLRALLDTQLDVSRRPARSVAP